MIDNYLMSWSNVPLVGTDPILGLTDAFRADEHPKKINVGVGAYRDNEGLPYVLECVRQAETALLPEKYGNHEYAPIEGLAEFNRLSAELIYGSACPTEKIAIIQTISGSGALFLGAAFLSRFWPSKRLLVPNPTWGNHGHIFRSASSFDIISYPYYDPQTLQLDHAGLLASIDEAPAQSIVLLHGCAHNPTGIDPTREQWREIHRCIKKRGFLVFFDLAYQGFASGDLAEDAWAVRLFVSDPPGPVLVSQSYAKNMGLYGERVGSLSIPCVSVSEKDAVLSQLKSIARGIYSSPPIHGARIVAMVLGTKELRDLWQQELRNMTGRIVAMRQALRAALEARCPQRDWTHITSQIGMFCYTGLDAPQVDRLVAEFHVYMTKDGRISMAGVTTHNVETLADAISEVVSGRKRKELADDE